MSEKEESDKTSSMPDGIPAPPPPAPDVIDPSGSNPTYGGKKSSKKKKKKKGRKHPTDTYDDVRKKKGCGGCFGCLGGVAALIIVGFIALCAAVYFVGPGAYLAKEGYEPVTFQEPKTVISEAPDKPTMYMGQNITYNAPRTDVPIAIFGQEVLVEGDFVKNVSLTGIKVTGSDKARFAEDLEVFAMEFYDKGIFLKGNLKGRVMKSLQ